MASVQVTNNLLRVNQIETDIFKARTHRLHELARSHSKLCEKRETMRQAHNCQDKPCFLRVRFNLTTFVTGGSGHEGALDWPDNVHSIISPPSARPPSALIIRILQVESL